MNAPRVAPESGATRPARSAGWLSRERVFRLGPFAMVQGMFVLVMVLPFALTIYISLLRWRANRPFEQASFYGFANYTRILSDADFWWSLARTFYFSGAAVTLELLIGFVLAMLAYKQIRGRRLYITVFLVPMMVVPVVVGYNFSMIYIDSGPLNQLLAPLLTPFGIDPRIKWLSNPFAAQWAVILADVWQWTSLTFLIFLSGFAALPQELINAARVMGASRWQIFWRVQLPLLKPVIVIAVIIRSMEALKLFDPVVLLTSGGPGSSTETVTYFLYRQVWQFNKFSYGAAATIVLLVIFSALIFGGIYLMVRERAALQYETGR
ncbi:MAG: carbohydrate ABC transporter permease [Gammaproteobacteria bacterium]